MKIDQEMFVHAGVAIALGALLVAATRGRPTVVEEDGTLRFRYSWLFRGFAFFSGIVLPLGVIVLIFFVPIKNLNDLLGAAVLFGLFFGLGIPLWREASRFALVVSEEGLDCQSPWRSRKFIAWNEVESISFSTMNLWFIIKAKDGRKFRVHVFVSGVSVFLEKCEWHLPTSALVGAKLGYAQVGRPFPMS